MKEKDERCCHWLYSLHTFIKLAFLKAPTLDPEQQLSVIVCVCLSEIISKDCHIDYCQYYTFMFNYSSGTTKWFSWTTVVV